jgi:hypothetical protein
MKFSYISCLNCNFCSVVAFRIIKCVPARHIKNANKFIKYMCLSQVKLVIGSLLSWWLALSQWATTSFYLRLTGLIIKYWICCVLVNDIHLENLPFWGLGTLFVSLDVWRNQIFCLLNVKKTIKTKISFDCWYSSPIFCLTQLVLDKNYFNHWRDIKI